MGYDIVALGESLIDFTPEGTGPLGTPLYSQNPGGAPANVLAMAAKLGLSTAFIGKVGDDPFGRFLQTAMEGAGIDCRGLVRDPRYHTTLAFVHLDGKGDRSFSFYREAGADRMLRVEDVADLVTDCRIFHFGSVSLTGEPCRSATLSAARRARDAGALVSFDPNYRPLLWEGEEEARRTILEALPLAGLLKVSGEEMELLTGERDLERGAARLCSMGPEAVFVTLGEKGAYFQVPAGTGRLPAYAVSAVDTTGAGDAFLGALLSQIPGRGREAFAALSLEDWQQAVRTACAAGGLTASAKGAIPAMPDPARLEACVRAGITR
ncbi:MAG TPA: carbohydrate kinase [Candidatus Intestinimonas stercoravium]|nr:carbohydrate kinase [Candidatus Intestinimonas stercoravium]